MNRQEIVDLYDELVDLGGHGSLEFRSYNPTTTMYKITIHSTKKIMSKLMSRFVIRTGILLKKSLSSLGWQEAEGEGDNLKAIFFPKENAFLGCKLKKKTKKVLVPANEEHYETRITYEVECDGFKETAK